ncbi:SDR family NAD(P)-dependent oxidoreductase [Methylobacterium sp. J-077]|uniref:SDR family NAD(P)-dependent oxidoreductase n=1 Tax=Methylobacterium sp. J-077 TaxID=2836656 RepID=UPI001FBBE56C|nr:SDR family oxidoreductase [Methylobacterium sp. J-077]MCJ2126966.1 SDR family oxidoreductase [Methylobacterium sp. J-077]
MTDYALVTGGSRNIGGAIAQRLTADGFKVIVLDVVKPEHDALDDFVEVDLSDAAALPGTLANAIAGRTVTRLVNNAGIVAPASLEDTDPASLDAVSAVNLKAPILCAQALLPGMKAAGRGRIVNISSRVALGKELRTVYAATKAGLHGMTKTWALELGRHGITVNAVGPGPIRTSLFDAVNPTGDPRTDAIIRAVPVARLGTPDDVADAVSFFLSDRAGFVTGQVLYVCGGMTIGSA